MATFVELSTKAKMPIVGLGTWKVSAQSWAPGLGISSSFYDIYWEFGTLETEHKLVLPFVLFQTSKL
jgi:diketogulonate reductase-like aldo/keto reductase